MIAPKKCPDLLSKNTGGATGQRATLKIQNPKHKTHMEKITITNLEGQWPNQSIEFVSFDGTLKTVYGEILEQRELPTGQLIEVHTELDENENVVNRIFVTY